MVVGFSTGSLALGNVRLGLKMVTGLPTAAIELSALREEELLPLARVVDSLDLRQFNYISVHAPSRLKDLSECEVVSILAGFARRGWPVVVHPDVIVNFDAWAELGRELCLENMDKRKAVGRTSSELAGYFARLPLATLCFDIGHARQIDPTMCEADAILRRFRDRIQQIHVSLVNSSSAHQPLNYESVLAFRRVAHLLPKDVPLILETPVAPEQIRGEIEKIAWILE
ncbi:MAG TPA: hypothetical protein VHC19_02710 [Pirellulales bacterium]|nr:hypothetical protein [Pirellulales bacterium]